MKHIKEKDDWFYELRPYIIIGIAICGALCKSLFGPTQTMNTLGFLSILVLITCGGVIVSMRRDYRKVPAKTHRSRP